MALLLSRHTFLSGALNVSKSSFVRSPLLSRTVLTAKKPLQISIPKRRFMDYNGARILRQANKQPAQLPGWLVRFLAEKPVYPRYSSRWWWEKFVMCVVFAITGSTTAYFVRPFVEKVLNLKGSLWEGPWAYRAAYVVTITPIYSVLLVIVGTIFGRHAFFKRFAQRMWTRMMPRF
eukprot:Phypoly_transcript_18521.p1 GENE.Phypoly_transcript_18521~~Phypoly_transcript_18521.p1  ORF type:complete len:199 (+),score=3.19 Phypoly_transcript_18521:70-597(+)